MSRVGLAIVERKARKAHACYWCQPGIVAGEQYIETRSVEDGRIDTFRVHLDCHEAEVRAYKATRPMEDEPSCLNTDIDGGRHERGRQCEDCGGG